MPAFRKAPATAQTPGTLVQRTSPPACRPAEPRGQLSSSHVELPSRTAEGSNQRPQVQEDTHPAGGHLDPEDGPAPAEEGFDVGAFIAAETREHPWSEMEENRWGEGLFYQASPCFCPSSLSFFLTTGFIYNSLLFKVYNPRAFIMP